MSTLFDLLVCKYKRDAAIQSQTATYFGFLRFIGSIETAQVMP